jgi:thymidylate synthase (FAD)
MPNVLDHGFVKLIDKMGDDAAIVQAARVSYGSGTKTFSEDAALIRYLFSHKHTTPFEMCEIKLLCKMPIFVARQWVRHRTASINEYSARYSVVKEDFYVPSVEQLCKQSLVNKQGRGERISEDSAEILRASIIHTSLKAYQLYESMIGDGVARETARMVLPINFYTEWYWKIDLHNLLGFLRLRMDAHAQYEIRVYADAIAEITKEWVPQTWGAFYDYALHSRAFSRMEVEVIKRAMKTCTPLSHPSMRPEGMSDREWTAFIGSVT